MIEVRAPSPASCSHQDSLAPHSLIPLRLFLQNKLSSQLHFPLPLRDPWENSQTNIVVKVTPRSKPYMNKETVTLYRTGIKRTPLVWHRFEMAQLKLCLERARLQVSPLPFVSPSLAPGLTMGPLPVQREGTPELIFNPFTSVPEVPSWV